MTGSLKKTGYPRSSGRNNSHGRSGSAGRSALACAGLVLALASASAVPASATPGSGGSARGAGELVTSAGLAKPDGVRRVKPATGFGSNWTTYHQNALSTGVDPAGTTLSPLSGAWTSPVLDGELFGEPLLDQGRVIVATENDTIYELAANTGRTLWSRHLGPPVPSSDLPCGDISPKVGITDTPVIDPGRDEVFVEADQLTGASGASHHLYGLDLFSGRIELSQVVDPPGSDPLAQLQRTALTLADGQVVIGFGGNSGDCSDYHGWVVAVPEAGGPLRTFEVDAAHGDSQGAVWMGGAAPVVDPSGNVWVSTGNGSVSDPAQPYDDSDGVLELSASMHLEQFFAPSSWASDNGSDADLGSTAPVLVDGLVFVVGKGHVAYLLRQSKLGGIGGDVASMGLCNNDPDGGLAVSGSTVYVPCGDGLTAVSIDAATLKMTVLWTTSTGSSGPAVIAGGRVWTIDQGGTLYGLNPQNGDPLVSESIRGEDNHFPTPAVADGLLLAPAIDRISAFKGPGGLPPPPPPAPTATRYWVAEANGNVFPFGGAPNHGSAVGMHLERPVVGMTATAGGAGYWLAASDGGVFSFGDARFHGSKGGQHLNAPIVGIASTPDGGGYWLVASDGGIFSFGDARFHGSKGGEHLNKPIVGMAATPDGGYWLVASDGGIFSFGDARFHGSKGGAHLNKPIVGMTATPRGAGYWLVASDGGIFTFGDAPYRGSLGGRPPASPVSGMAGAPDGGGYWMVDMAGTVAGFGDAEAGGSPPASQVVTPVVAVTATP